MENHITVQEVALLASKTRLSLATIKTAFSLPLEKVCDISDIKEVKRLYSVIHNGPEGEVAALLQWRKLSKELNKNVKNMEQAIFAVTHAPPHSPEKKAALIKRRRLIKEVVRFEIALNVLQSTHHDNYADYDPFLVRAIMLAENEEQCLAVLIHTHHGTDEQKEVLQKLHQFTSNQ